MALIGTIRNNSWILVVVIGLGLVAFIMMSSQTDGPQGGATTNFTMGKVDGQAVDFQEMDKVDYLLYRNSSVDVFARRNQLWNYFVEEAIITKQADALGLKVSPDELTDLQYGANPSPVITNRYRNPQTGLVDKAQLEQIRQQIIGNQLTEDNKALWLHQEKEIIKERLQSKLNMMVSKALFTPDWMVEQTYGDQTQRIAFDYVRVPFSAVNDSEVKLSDSDYSAYLNANKGRYMQDEETRKVSYIVFDVVPTVADSAAIKAELATTASNFAAATNDTSFVEAYYGRLTPQWIAESALPDNMKEGIANTAQGQIYGPYVQGNTYEIVKVRNRQMLPDSSTSRHILINAADEAGFAIADSKIDSIKAVIQSGKTSFEDLAKTLSEDTGSKADGGKYENITPGQFVPEYEEVMLTGDLGKLYKVKTAFGVHLIEPISRTSSSPHVKIAQINKNIVPSDETQTAVSEKAYNLIENNKELAALNAAVSQSTDLISITNSTALKANDFQLGTLGGGNSAREIIKYAYAPGTSVGQVSDKVYNFQNPQGNFTDKYVVVALKDIQGAGMPSVNSIKEEIESLVRNQKKGELLKGKVSGSDLTAIANQFSSEVDQTSNVTFDSKFTAGLGDEPKVIAAAFSLDVNGVSQPIVGNNGVYVVKLTDKPSVGTNFNVAQLRKNTSSSTQTRVSAGLIQAMKKSADVEDLRSKFY